MLCRSLWLDWIVVFTTAALGYVGVFSWKWPSSDDIEGDNRDKEECNELCN